GGWGNHHRKELLAAHPAFIAADLALPLRKVILKKRQRLRFLSFVEHGQFPSSSSVAKLICNHGLRPALPHPFAGCCLIQHKQGTCATGRNGGVRRRRGERVSITNQRRVET